MIASPNGVATVVTWVASGAALLCVLVRPRGIAEWWWAFGGALVLVAFGLVPPLAAVRAAASGFDVYLFLIGMMLLAELARVEGVFDWLAAHALAAANGSRLRLFALTYGVGVLVTALLSNDATAVVLTPAVAAAAGRAGVPPLPYLFGCAFVANAASFVLPISNPANLVVFRDRLPALVPWLAAFGLPSLAAVLLTFVALAALSRRSLRGRCDAPAPAAALGRAGTTAFVAIALAAAALVGVAWRGVPLGLPTLALGAAATAAVAVVARRAPRNLAGVSWSVVPLVAGLFVIVAALDRTGALAAIHRLLLVAARLPPQTGALLVAGVLTVADNALNNLPVALATGIALAAAPPPPHLGRAALIAVDLGPNLSVTGSLATLLWLIAVRRVGLDVSPWRFLAAGTVVLLPALVAAVLLAS